MAEKNNDEWFLLGIDDAGRGPVIGPMVLAGCLMTPEIEKELAGLGVTDSKLLTRKKRTALEKLIKQKALAHHAHYISPAEIDTGMGTGLNLNEVEALASGIIIGKILETVEKESKKIKILVDCPSPNINAWTACLKKYVGAKNAEIKCSHKADLKYPVVSAASILAKVARDIEIDKLKKEIGIDFGSGYTHDPKTKKFLEKHINNEKFRKNHLFRESWSTWRKANSNKSQTKLPDY